MKNYEIKEKILLDYLRGELSQEEKKMVDQWYESAKENREILENLYYAFSLKERIDIIESLDSDQYLAEFKQKVRQSSGASAIRTNRIKLNYIISRGAIAALFALAITFTGLWLSDIARSAAKPIVMRTAVGEMVNIELPDGSLVWLNSCSELRFSRSLISKDRIVELDGEAYFNVKKKNGAKFIVTSGEISIHVLGTKFNICANRDENLITTTLLEGSIMITSTKIENSVMMSPCQQLVFNKQTYSARLTNCADMTDSKSIDWIDGRLCFEQATLEDIVVILQRHYNIKIVIRDNDLRKVPFTCSFKSSDNINQIFSILQLTGKFEYKIDGRQLEIF